MLETMELDPAAAQAEALPVLVDRVCTRIPPLWDLENYVAVNPFLGFVNQPIGEALKTLGDGLGAETLPPISYFREQFAKGRLDPSCLGQAASRSGLSAVRIQSLLEGIAPVPTRRPDIELTYTEKYDHTFRTHWQDIALRQVARWCAIYVGGEATTWASGLSGRGLFESWREAAAVDRTLEISGLSGYRQWAKKLPESADEAIEATIEQLNIAPDRREAYLYRLIGQLYGWASYFRRGSWQAGSTEAPDVRDLLAILASTDLAVFELSPKGKKRRTLTAIAEVESEQVRMVLQEAMEDTYAGRLFQSLNPAPVAAAPKRPAVQAVFCIDVRSEPLRRHLEAASDTVETLGFAGFFGVALEWQQDQDGAGSARCPVLLKPSVTVRGAQVAPPDAAKRVTKYLQSAPAAAFSFVELTGVAYAVKMIRDSFTRSRTAAPAEGLADFSIDATGPHQGIPLASRVTLAAGILKNIGLRAPYARLVLLCGHGGSSANNPHAAGLDCGACGGHGGGINARVAAAILNDPLVRAQLAERGSIVPSDTWFVPGLHDTSSDAVTLLDAAAVPADHSADLAELRKWLTYATEKTRAERAAALGLAPNVTESRLSRLLHRRANDWSEVRPEWALARNAAFIAGRRYRTRGVDLAGRAFLHEYDASTDHDGSVLRLILSAPMVVASWINLQYFASTVDNRVLGAGDKTLHNRVGTAGVVLGNGGDLRTGLPAQSVHAPDGTWFHEPMRLQVVIETTTDALDAALADLPAVRDLVENGWVRLFALSPSGNEVVRRIEAGEWIAAPSVAATLPPASESERNS